MGLNLEIGWLLNALLASFISSAGFCFLALAAEYVKNYHHQHQEREKLLLYQLARRQMFQEWKRRTASHCPLSRRSKSTSIFESYKRSSVFMSCKANPWEQIGLPKLNPYHRFPVQNFLWTSRLSLPVEWTNEETTVSSIENVPHCKHSLFFTQPKLERGDAMFREGEALNFCTVFKNWIQRVRRSIAKEKNDEIVTAQANNVSVEQLNNVYGIENASGDSDRVRMLYQKYTACFSQCSALQNELNSQSFLSEENGDKLSSIVPLLRPSIRQETHNESRQEAELQNLAAKNESLEKRITRFEEFLEKRNISTRFLSSPRKRTQSLVMSSNKNDSTERNFKKRGSFILSFTANMSQKGNISEKSYTQNQDNQRKIFHNLGKKQSNAMPHRLLLSAKNRTQSLLKSSTKNGITEKNYKKSVSFSNYKVNDTPKGTKSEKSSTLYQYHQKKQVSNSGKLLSPERERFLSNPSDQSNISGRKKNDAQKESISGQSLTSQRENEMNDPGNIKELLTKTRTRSLSNLTNQSRSNTTRRDLEEKKDVHEGNISGKSPTPSQDVKMQTIAIKNRSSEKREDWFGNFLRLTRRKPLSRNETPYQTNDSKISHVYKKNDSETDHTSEGSHTRYQEQKRELSSSPKIPSTTSRPRSVSNVSFQSANDTDRDHVLNKKVSEKSDRISERSPTPSQDLQMGITPTLHRRYLGTKNVTTKKKSSMLVIPESYEEHENNKDAFSSHPVNANKSLAIKNKEMIPRSHFFQDEYNWKRNHTTHPTTAQDRDDDAGQKVKNITQGEQGYKLSQVLADANSDESKTTSNQFRTAIVRKRNTFAKKQLNMKDVYDELKGNSVCTKELTTAIKGNPIYKESTISKEIEQESGDVLPDGGIVPLEDLIKIQSKMLERIVDGKTKRVRSIYVKRSRSRDKQTKRTNENPLSKINVKTDTEKQTNTTKQIAMRKKKVTKPIKSKGARVGDRSINIKKKRIVSLTNNGTKSSLRKPKLMNPGRNAEPNNSKQIVQSSLQKSKIRHQGRHEKINDAPPKPDEDVKLIKEKSTVVTYRVIEDDERVNTESDAINDLYATEDNNTSDKEDTRAGNSSAASRCILRKSVLDEVVREMKSRLDTASATHTSNGV